MKKLQSSKGFTLVEIMIVVVIIGLLAAMAIPAFQKVRQSSLEKTVLNDARQIGAAIQQYCMEYGVTQVVPTPTYTITTGLLTGNDQFTAYLKQIGKNYTVDFDAKKLGADLTDSFTLKLQGAFGSTPSTFNGEGKKVSTNK